MQIIQRILILCFFSLFVITNLNAQSKKALLIGISDYGYRGLPDTWTNIHGANDVNLLYPTLKNKGFFITKICDKEATAKKIRSKFKKLISSCKLGDFVYVHFSGHGQPYEDLDGDEEDGWDESIIPYDAQLKFVKGKYEGNNHITDDELNKYIRELQSKVGVKGFVFVLLDACHAGGSSRGEDEDEEDVQYCRGTKTAFTPSGKEFRPRINARSHFKISKDNDDSHVIILEACRSYQSNYEIKENGQYYGPLSYNFNKVLLSSNFSLDIILIFKVKQIMDQDRRLVRQNMVYESSIQ